MEKYINTEKITSLTSQLLEAVGENINRDGLLETPKRVAKMYNEILSGYDTDLNSIFKVFECSKYTGMVTVQGIDFFSMCEHHILPFFGKVHIGYKPRGKILGLSKFARLVEVFSRRLQTQENITEQLALCLMDKLELEGCIVVIESRHLCMEMRGIKKGGSVTTTEVKKGIFNDNPALVSQFYSSLRKESI